MFDTDTHASDEMSAGELEQAEHHADELHKLIDRTIAASPGLDADTVARVVFGQLPEELRETLAAGGDEAEQLAELATLTAVEQVIRDA
jgi:hypothetical protein